MRFPATCPSRGANFSRQRQAALPCSRAQGCLLGQLAGDALGSAVEFRSAAQIARSHPDGVTRLSDGGTWNLIAGQPTDDSELAMALARGPALATKTRWAMARALRAREAPSPEETEEATVLARQARAAFAGAGISGEVDAIDQWLAACGPPCAPKP